MVAKLFNRFLPFYVCVGNNYYFSVWSAPTTPCSQLDYLRSLRITLREGEYHTRVIRVLKTGTL